LPLEREGRPADPVRLVTERAGALAAALNREATTEAKKIA
jgi:hypothetical protein